MIDIEKISRKSLNSEKKNLDIFAKKYENIFVLICDKNYIKYVDGFIKSKKLFSNSWGILLFIIKDNPSLIYNNNNRDLYAIEIVLEDLRKNKKDLIKNISANIRAPIIYNICKFTKFKYLIYCDVDSVVIKNPISFCKNLEKNNSLIAFREEKSHLFTRKNGCIPFKSGVIVCINSKNKRQILLKILNAYSRFVTDRYSEWFSDQRGLVYISIDPRFSYYISPTSYFLNDWSFSPNSLIWTAKGNRKNSSNWTFINSLFDKLNKNNNITYSQYKKLFLIFSISVICKKSLISLIYKKIFKSLIFYIL